jgi:uncharacterized protein
MSLDCVVYRCARQPELYLYLRAGLAPAELPEALRRRTGALTQVMALSLSPTRKLARVDAARVIAALERDGYYLQLPPDGLVAGHLQFGD